MKLSRFFIFGTCAIAVLFAVMGCNENTNIGANWTLVSVTADGTPLSTEDGSLTQTLTLFVAHEPDSTDFQISGFSGVNNFMGTFTMNDKTAQVSPLVATMMMGPESDVKTESVFLAALQNGGTVSLEEKNDGIFLTIENKETNTSLVFKQTLLENTAWNLTMYNIGNAVTSIPTDIEGASIAFAPEGKLYGSTGVNRISGAYTFAPDGKITVSTVALTRMAAPNEEAAKFEMLQVELLEQAVFYGINGTTLTLRNSDGETLLVYEK